MKHKLLFLFTLFVLVVAPNTAFGQPSPIGGASISLEPRFPQPNTEVTLEFNSYSSDITTAHITWYMEGIPIQQGTFLKKITVTTPRAGAQNKIVAIAETLQGQIISAEHLLQSNTLTIIVNAKTYTPPFYKGKALPVVGADAVLTAFPEMYTPEGSLVDPETLSYSWWSDGGSLNTSLSGKGGRSVVLHNPYFMRDIFVYVEATNPLNGAKVGGRILIPKKQPLVVLYENHPLWGIWYNNVLPESFVLEKAEIAITAEPYFFASPYSPSNLLFDWIMSGIAAPFRSSGATLVFRPADSAEGISEISLRVWTGAKNMNAMLQKAEVAFFVTFGSSAGKVDQGSDRELPIF